MRTSATFIPPVFIYCLLFFTLLFFAFLFFACFVYAIASRRPDFRVEYHTSTVGCHHRSLPSHALIRTGYGMLFAVFIAMSIAVSASAGNIAGHSMDTHSVFYYLCLRMSNRTFGTRPGVVRKLLSECRGIAYGRLKEAVEKKESTVAMLFNSLIKSANEIKYSITRPNL